MKSISVYAEKIGGGCFYIIRASHCNLYQGLFDHRQDFVIYPVLTISVATKNRNDLVNPHLENLFYKRKRWIVNLFNDGSDLFLLAPTMLLGDI